MRAAALAFLVAASAASAQSQAAEGDPILQARRMAASEMSRLGAALDYRPGPKAGWSYTTGLFAYALLRLGAVAGDEAASRYASRVINSFILPDGTIRGYSAAEYNLDLITPGRAVLALYEADRDPRLAKAAGALRAQLAAQPRTSDGGFWHKLIYPDQMWLDGLYMAGPFYAHYGALFGEPADRGDAVHQLVLADRHLYDPGTGLFYHAWDARGTQAWASPQGGHSPSFWGRAEGWFAMATVDELDDLPAGGPPARDARAILARLAEGIVRWQDPASGVWWQVLDQGARPGNYLESSASCMFVYALAKGINRGYLPRERFLPAARAGYRGLLREFVSRDTSGALSLTRCCSVAGLNNRSAGGRPRDGSFGYYVSEPVVDNDLKAVSPFILACLEAQRMPAPGRSTP